MPSLKCVLVATVLASVATAKTITITAKSDQKFDPDNVTADKGDIVLFEFEPKNHSVVAGDFKEPCSPMNLGNGFYSGFIASKDGKADNVFRVTINSTDPIPFYSSQGNECSKGMVGVINPSKNQTVDDYRKAASKLSKGVTPGSQAYGGEVESSKDIKDDGNKDDGNKDGGNKDDDNKNGGGGLIAPMMGALVAVGGAAVYLL